MARSVAVNVAANTDIPGFRGPIHPDGSFTYVPIPEREPTRGDADVPTYADLDLPFPVPADVADTPVHLDPEFAEYTRCERYSYGDDYGVKARPIAGLDPGDSLYFYATLAVRERGFDPGTPPGSGVDAAARADWIAPEWGAYLIGELRVDRVVDGDAYPDIGPETRAALANNAHVKREPVDAEVFVVGTGASGLFDRAVPLSASESGSDANRLVTGLSSDSGRGPWWRRPLRFDAAATRELRAIVAAADPARAVEPDR